MAIDALSSKIYSQNVIDTDTLNNSEHTSLQTSHA